MDDSIGTFPKAISIITVGMVIPALLVALAGNTLITSFKYGAFLSVLGLGFGLVVIVLLEWLSLDRITFAFASLVWPWVVFFTALFGILLLNEGEQIPRGPMATIVRTLYGDPSIWGTESSTQLAYGAIFMLAGVGAAALSAFLEERNFQSTDHSE